MIAPFLVLLGQTLEPCSTEPVTGWLRTGCCETDDNDVGRHVVCIQATADFLEFSRSRGNDLSTPHPGFPGLRPGDRWCICAARWAEAHAAGVAPPVFLAGTHESVVEVCDRAALLENAIDSHNLN
jgi:uncharacterized protein (DUF2237 family)